MTRLEGKVAIITGSNSGIGLATAIDFLKNGANVVITGRNVKNLAEAKKKCIETSASSECVLEIAGDLRNETFRKSLVEQTVARYKRIDILVNNAGAVKYLPIETATLDEIEYIMSLNVKAPFQLIQLTLPYLKETKGNIINISSIAANIGVCYMAPYCASKAALNQITRSAALELAHHGIRVNSIDAGCVRTPILSGLGMTDADLDALAKNQPMKRIADSSEIATVATFLADNNTSSFVTGTNLIADGGFLAGHLFPKPEDAKL